MPDFENHKRDLYLDKQKEFHDFGFCNFIKNYTFFMKRNEA